MRTTRRAILGTAAASVTLAGCTGGDAGSEPTDSPTETEATDTQTAESGDDAGATVQVSSHPDHGDILVDPEGMTLYMFDQDERGSGSSTCSGDCLDNWPPLTVDEAPTAGEDVEAELSTFEREGGDTQVAANGWPLYYFAPDEEPGDASGQGAGDVWWVLDPDGEPIKPDSDETEEDSDDTVQVSSHSDHGDILVDPEGMTLYMFDQDEQGADASSCSGDCLDNWPALTVEDSATAGEAVSAEISTFEREGGDTQVAANGWPLYYFASDEEPGDASGQGAGDVWWVLDPAGEPIKPDEDTATEDGGGMY